MNHLVLSSRLKELRMKNHYTQAYISAQLNIGRATYSNYELGKRMPSVDIIADFAKFYHVDISYLLSPCELDDSAATLDDSECNLLDDEKYILSLYRGLPTPQKQELSDFAAFLSTHHRAL